MVDYHGMCKMDRYSVRTEKDIDTVGKKEINERKRERDCFAMYFQRNPLAVVTEGRFDTTDNPDSEMHSGRSFAV